MAKRSGYLMRQKAFTESVQEQTQDFTKQLLCDLFAINIRQHGISELECRKICEDVFKDYAEVSDLWNAPKSKDKEKTEVKGKLDRILQRLCPTYFSPWEERYK